MSGQTYVNAIATLAQKYPKINFYFCGVSGVYSGAYSEVSNSTIDSFNQNAKSAVNSKSLSNLKYMEVGNANVQIGSQSKTVNDFINSGTSYAPDGLHYSESLYKAIWEQVMTNTAASSSSESSSKPMNLGISISMNDLLLAKERNTYEDYRDVLADKTFYADVGELDSDSVTDVEQKAGRALEIVTSIGIVLAVLIPAFVGIKYMIFNNINAKRDMVPYFVGAVMLFGVCTITKIIMIIGKGINSI